MAKATTTSGEPAKKAVRKTAAPKAAATTEEGGATAPVSLSGDQAAAVTPTAAPAPVDPAAATDAATGDQTAPPAGAPAGDSTADSSAQGDGTDAGGSDDSAAIDGAAGSDGPASDPAAAGEAGEGSARTIVLVGAAPLFPGMGRFPLDWKPTPRAGADESEQTQAPDLDDSEEAQTDEIEGSEQALQSSAWGLPDITEFPVELTLENNTRNPLLLRALNIKLRPFSKSPVICPSASKYDATKRELAMRSQRERWDSKIGLQVVKHGED